MTSQGPIASSTTNAKATALLPVNLLMWNKQYAVTIAQSIIKDVDLDECSEHETESLGDIGYSLT